MELSNDIQLEHIPGTQQFDENLYDIILEMYEVDVANWDTKSDYNNEPPPDYDTWISLPSSEQWLEIAYDMCVNGYTPRRQSSMDTS